MFLHDVGSLERQIHLLELGKQSANIMRIHEPSFHKRRKQQQQRQNWKLQCSLVRFRMKNFRLYFEAALTMNAVVQMLFHAEKKSFSAQFLIKPPEWVISLGTDINELNVNGWQLTVAETKWLSSLICICMCILLLLLLWHHEIFFTAN